MAIAALCTVIDMSYASSRAALDIPASYSADVYLAVLMQWACGDHLL